VKLSSASYLFKQGVRNIWTNRIMSFASFCILMVSLLMIGFTVLFTLNINLFIGSVENKNEVIIFLDDDVTDEMIEQMEIKLRNMDNISEVVFYSKEEAFADMKADMKNAEELFNYVGDESPLPDSFKIRVKNINRMTSTVSQIKSMTGIYEVKAPNDFVNILRGLKSVTAVISGAILIALVVVSLVIISNTARASVDIRKREIAIMKYVGATNAFIKIPFFVEGMLTGIIAGVAATVITWLGYNKLAQVLTSDMTLWSALGITGVIQFSSIWIRVALCYTAAGALISAIGTVLSTRKYVKV
jgi:cell division transport system permease protein